MDYSFGLKGSRAPNTCGDHLATVPHLRQFAQKRAGKLKRLLD